MKTLIIYASTHKGNTKKLAERLAQALKADLVEFDEMNRQDYAQYDLIGFGSGVYHFNFHKGLLKHFRDLYPMPGKKAFVFATSGSRHIPLVNPFFAKIRKRLSNRGFDIVGEFSCRGYSDAGFGTLFKYFNVGHPTEADLHVADEFASELQKKIEILK